MSLEFGVKDIVFGVLYLDFFGLRYQVCDIFLRFWFFVWRLEYEILGLGFWAFGLEFGVCGLESWSLEIWVWDLELDFWDWEIGV